MFLLCRGIFDLTDAFNLRDMIHVINLINYKRADQVDHQRLLNFFFRTVCPLNSANCANGAVLDAKNCECICPSGVSGVTCEGTVLLKHGVIQKQIQDDKNIFVKVIDCHQISIWISYPT